MPVCRKGAEIETRKKREERREKREEEVLPTSEPSLNPLRMWWSRAKKIHLISEKLVLAVAKERFERTIHGYLSTAVALLPHKKGSSARTVEPPEPTPATMALGAGSY